MLLSDKCLREITVKPFIKFVDFGKNTIDY